MPTGAPSQIFNRHPHGLLEVIRIFCLDFCVECLADAEAVIRKLRRVITRNNLVLVREPMRQKIHKRNQRVLTLTRAKIALTVLNTGFKGEASAAFLSRISILSSRRDN